MIVKRYVLGDPQAPFVAVMKLLASYDALATNGYLRLIPSFFAKHRPPCYWASYGSSGRRAILLAIFAIQSGP